MNLSLLGGLVLIALFGFGLLFVGRVARFVGVALVAVSIGSFGSILSRAARCAGQFGAIGIGATQSEVERRIGSPSQITDCSTTFGGYQRGAGERAAPGCVTEYWYYAVWAPEAWSFAFDSEGRLIDKYHWVSP
jgi:hypothetical protein